MQASDYGDIFHVHVLEEAISTQALSRVHLNLVKYARFEKN